MMSLDLHRQAEAHMAEADRLHTLGQEADAAAAYGNAAELEAAAFRRIPSERVRTRGIIAISAISLYRQAGQPEAAVRIAHEALAALPSEHPVWKRIEQLMDDARNERRAKQADLNMAADVFEWVLKGGAVEVGQAPIDLVLDKVRQIDRLGVRVFEHLAGHPLRTSATVPADVRHAFRMVVTQPTAGSFRFSTRFEMPAVQMRLFATNGGSGVDPDRLSDEFDAILTAAQDFDPDAMEQVVADRDYREAFLRLLRDVAPDGRNVATVEMRRRRPDFQSVVYLRTGLRQAISQRLAASRARRDDETEQTAVLRVVDLNRGWIRLGPKGQESQWWVGGTMVIEEIIEGLINKSVHVVGHWHRSRLLIDDIEEAPTDTPSDSQ
jgi:hypothetical protein